MTPEPINDGDAKQIDEKPYENNEVSMKDESAVNGTHS